MQKSPERQRLRMVQDRGMLLERVQLREVRRTSMMALEIVMRVGRGVHGVEAAVMVVVMMVLLMRHLIVQVLQLRLPGTALVLNS